MEDQQRNEATVYLLTHRVEVGSYIFSVAGYLIPVNDVADQDRGKHWALLIHYNDDEDSEGTEDSAEPEEASTDKDESMDETDQPPPLKGSLYVCELERFDMTGDIITVCRKTTRKEIKKHRKARRIYKLGNTRVPGEQLVEYVTKHESNAKKYNLFSRNCQHWAQILTKELDLPDMFNKNEELSSEDEAVYEYELLEDNFLHLSSGDSKSLRALNKYKRIIGESFDKVAEENIGMDSAEIKEYLDKNLKEAQEKGAYHTISSIFGSVFKKIKK